MLSYLSENVDLAVLSSDLFLIQSAHACSGELENKQGRGGWLGMECTSWKVMGSVRVGNGSGNKGSLLEVSAFWTFQSLISVTSDLVPN